MQNLWTQLKKTFRGDILIPHLQIVLFGILDDSENAYFMTLNHVLLAFKLYFFKMRKEKNTKT